MLQGFLVALVSALIYLESRLVGQHMLDRPIIIGLWSASSWATP